MDKKEFYESNTKIFYNNKEYNDTNKDLFIEILKESNTKQNNEIVVKSSYDVIKFVVFCCKFLQKNDNNFNDLNTALYEGLYQYPIYIE